MLPVLLVVLAACVGVLVCVSAQLACVDAARSAARAAARGEDVAVVQQVGRRLAPAGATVSVRPGGETVEVRIQTRVRPFGRALRLPAVPVAGRAVASVERSP